MLLHEVDSEEGCPAALRSHLAHTLLPFAHHYDCCCDGQAAIYLRELIIYCQEYVLSLERSSGLENVVEYRSVLLWWWRTGRSWMKWAWWRAVSWCYFAVSLIHFLGLLIVRVVSTTIRLLELE